LINSDHFIGGSSSCAAMAGYPIVNVPAGFAFGLPVGLSFMGTAFSEPILIRLAYAFEQITKVRQAPKFIPILKLGRPITDTVANGSDPAPQATPLASPADTNSGNNPKYRSTTHTARASSSEIQQWAIIEGDCRSCAGGEDPGLLKEAHGISPTLHDTGF
jgi:hypothetical protein